MEQLPIPELTNPLKPSQPKPSPTAAELAAAKKQAPEYIRTDDHQVVYEIHDILEAYYDISVQHYIDAVCRTGLSKRFVEGVVDVFSDDFVAALSDREVRKIWGESEEQKRTMQELERIVGELEADEDEDEGN